MVEIVVPLASWQQVVLYFFKSGGIGQSYLVRYGHWPKIRSKRCVHFTADFSQSGSVISGGGSQILDLDDARNMNFAILSALAYDGLSAAVQKNR
jgi:hypothetical protein